MSKLAIFKGSGRAAFRGREYAALAGNKAYARVELYRLHKKGQIVPVKNGWWAFPDALPEAIACEMSAPCYLSFHSALNFHGLTTQSPREIQVAVARNSQKYFVHGTLVREYRVKKNQFNHFAKTDGLIVAAPEKALADAISLPKTCPQAVITEALKTVETEKIRPLLYSDAAKKRLRRLERHAKQERT